MTYDEVCRLDPEIKNYVEHLKIVPLRYSWHDIKRELSTLVGWNRLETPTRETADLYSASAWEAVVREIIGFVD